MMNRLCEQAFFTVLKNFRNGKLTLIRPDGQELHFGGQGPGPNALIRVHDRRFYRESILKADIGFGESFIHGYWETDDITAVIKWFLANQPETPGLSGSKRPRPVLFNLLGVINKFYHATRANRPEVSRKNIGAHYDLSNDFFRLFLDASMTYSSAYFQHPEQNLEEAQMAKYDQLCRKLRLKADDHVLEIGTGWGGFSLHAAQTYGCRITSLTISQQQYDYATRLIRQKGLSDRIQVELKDYRHVTGRFNKIASIEMLEAVGDEFLETYFRQCSHLLTEDGLMGLQVITCPDSRFHKLKNGVDFIQRHIFPGSLIPSVARIQQAVNRTSDLCLYGLEDMGHFYAKTLHLWQEKFNEQLESVRKLGFDQHFIRKWNYYLSYCHAGFAMRNISVVQMVLTRPNNLTLAQELGTKIS